MATTLLAGIVIFIAGVTVSGILLVSWGIRREERNFPLAREAPNPTSQGARRVMGLWVRQQTAPALERRPGLLV